MCLVLLWHLKCLKTKRSQFFCEAMSLKLFKQKLGAEQLPGSIRTVLGRSTFHHLSIAHANNAMRMADGTCCPGAGMVLWRITMAMMKILMVMTAMGIRWCRDDTLSSGNSTGKHLGKSANFILRCLENHDISVTKLQADYLGYWQRT